MRRPGGEASDVSATRPGIARAGLGVADRTCRGAVFAVAATRVSIGAGGGKDSGQPSNRRQDGTEAPAPAPQAAINSLTDGGALGWMPAAGNLAWRKP